MISVVVPNLHSPMVERTLDSLCNQNYNGPYEVIVVGQDCYGKVREEGRVRVINTPSPVAPAIARNVGIREARGEVIAFIDSDCLAAPDWLSRLTAHYQNPEVTVVGGCVEFPSDNYWTLCDNVATFHEYLSTSKDGAREQLPSLNLSIRKSAFNVVGVFDERYPLAAAEDADISTRLRMHGHTLYFDPKAKVIHLPNRRNMTSIFKHAYNFGRYSVKVDERYRKFLSTPVVLRNHWAMLFLSPFLSLAVVTRILLREKLAIRYWKTIPVIYAAKIAWCFGAAQTLRAGLASKNRISE